MDPRLRRSRLLLRCNPVPKFSSGAPPCAMYVRTAVPVKQKLRARPSFERPKLLNAVPKPLDPHLTKTRASQLPLQSLHPEQEVTARSKHPYMTACQITTRHVPRLASMPDAVLYSPAAKDISLIPPTVVIVNITVYREPTIIDSAICRSYFTSAVP